VSSALCAPCIYFSGSSAILSTSSGGNTARRARELRLDRASTKYPYAMFTVYRVTVISTEAAAVAHSLNTTTAHVQGRDQEHPDEGPRGGPKRREQRDQERKRDARDDERNHLAAEHVRRLLLQLAIQFPRPDWRGSHARDTLSRGRAKVKTDRERWLRSARSSPELVRGDLVRQRSANEM